MGSLQNQQRGADTCLAERHRLPSERDCKGIHYGFNMLRDLHGAMTVGVSFHDGHEPMRWQRFPKGANVLTDGCEIDVNRCRA